MCVSVCECASVSVCVWFYKLTHGPQKQILVFFLSGNLDFGLEKSSKNHGTFFWSFVGTSPWQGLPYIPRVHLSEGSLVRSPLKWLCSEEPMVRRSFITKFLYSESCYVPKIPYSERPSTIWILCYEDSLVRSSSSPKGAMFRTSIFRKSPLPHTGSILRRSFSPKFLQF